MNYDEILAKIRQQKNLSIEAIEEKIKEKLRTLSDLISKEGAAHIVANELGVKLFDNLHNKKIKINDLLGGMRSVTIAGKVVKLGNIYSYKKENREGKVANLFIADETGKMRVVFWDKHHIELLEQGKIKEGDILKITKANIRANNGFNELHTSGISDVVINPLDTHIEVLGERQHATFIEKKIKDLQEREENVALLGTIVQVFDPRFYPACPTCGKKVYPEGDKMRCPEHAVVQQEYAPIINLLLDDGSGTIRVTAFRNQAERIFNVDKAALQACKDTASNFEQLKLLALGRQVKFVGNVKMNEVTATKEFSLRLVLDYNPALVAHKIVEELQA
ncbi:MAG: OB-fold nucleic acid binding domain-containing protein [Nanoarchaeota archaeon]|nr:OB-fold nucleic acid binding domain-containing protein [Nanoarchaeota archaeon]